MFISKKEKNKTKFSSICFFKKKFPKTNSTFFSWPLPPTPISFQPSTAASAPTASQLRGRRQRQLEGARRSFQNRRVRNDFVVVVSVCLDFFFWGGGVVCLKCCVFCVLVFFKLECLFFPQKCFFLFFSTNMCLLFELWCFFVLGHFTLETLQGHWVSMVFWGKLGF